jgi:hypothetical protein
MPVPLLDRRGVSTGAIDAGLARLSVRLRLVRRAARLEPVGSGVAERETLRQINRLLDERLALREVR